MLLPILLLMSVAITGVNGFTSFVPPIARSTSLARKQFRMSQFSMEASAEQVDVARTKIPDMQAYSNGFKTVFEEQPCRECTPSDGTLPEDLVGTYFRSGPAMFSAGSIIPPKTSIVQPKGPPVPDGQDPERMVKHPFEADGGIMAVTFSGGKAGSVVSRFRYVRTNAFDNERRKGQRLYKAMDSTRALGPTAGSGLANDLPLPLFRHHLQPGLNKSRKNTSNTRAVYWGNRLLSLWEGGLPYKIDALALSTEGRSQLGGTLKEQNPFGAKAVYDPTKDRMLFYAVRPEPKSSELTLYEFDSKFRLVREQGGSIALDIPGFAMVSDFAATENYAVFVQPPVSVNNMQYMLSKEPGKILEVAKAASTLHLIPRVGSDRTFKSLTIPFDGIVDANLQFCNAYEEGNMLAVDAIQSDGTNVKSCDMPMSYPWMTTIDEFGQYTSKKSLVRYRVNLESGSVSKEVLSDLQCYFGVVNPAVSTQKHRFIYCAVGSLGSDVAPPQGIVKFDVDGGGRDDLWIPSEYEFCGEPMFTARQHKSSSDEDDGYILTVLFNGKTQESEMLVLSAKNLSAGPICRVPLGIGIPHGLHGCFSGIKETTWTAEEIGRRAKLADKMESRGNQWNEVKSDFSGLGLRLDDIEEYFGDIF